MTPIPVASLAGRWVTLVAERGGLEVWLDLGGGELRPALATMLFVSRGAAPARIVWGHQRPGVARVVVSYDELVRPNDFARWLRGQERAA